MKGGLKTFREGSFPILWLLSPVTEFEGLLAAAM